MRIISAYSFTNNLKYIIFLVLCTFQVMAHDWTVYVYMHADSAYEEALCAVRQLKDELGEDTSMKVCVDIQAATSHRIIFEDGLFEAASVNYGEDQLSVIKQGCDWAFKEAEGKTMVIISGHGTGILTPRYSGGWHYEKDVGPSPCKKYCTSQYETFCEQVTSIMNGKSLLTADTTTFLSSNDLRGVMKYLHDVLGRPVDILGLDSCYMAMLEIAYEVAPYARYMVASQESEEKDGWDYQEVIKALRYSDVLEAARKLVYSYERSQRLRGADRFSLSVFDLSLVAEVCLTLDRLVALCKAESLLGILCAARTKLHKVSGIPMYADLTEFVEELLMELDNQEATTDIDQINIIGISLLEQLSLMLPAVIAGPACSFLRGCLVYFPTAHIDSSYKATFVQEHAWYNFLKFFTDTEDMVAAKVLA